MQDTHNNNNSNTSAPITLNPEFELKSSTDAKEDGFDVMGIISGIKEVAVAGVCATVCYKLLSKDEPSKK